VEAALEPKTVRPALRRTAKYFHLDAEESMPLEYYHLQKLFLGMSLNSWQDVENRLEKTCGREGIRNPASSL
jgi:hypothetical protein